MCAFDTKLSLDNNIIGNDIIDDGTNDINNINNGIIFFIFIFIYYFYYFYFIFTSLFVVNASNGIGFIVERVD